MGRRSITDEERTMQYLKAATEAQLDSVIRAAVLIKEVKYGPEVANKRTRGPNKPKAETPPLEVAEYADSGGYRG